jgi:hypothetical protein
MSTMKNLFYTLLMSVLFASCARQGTLTGGIKDTIPPMLDTLNSTPNYVTQFDKRKIELAFNEWVVLKDVVKEILISPPLDPKPSFTLKKKSVIVDFGEKAAFRPNTTYTINFGSAVRDLHESNPAKDLRYVFSTGTAIDSLKVEGIINDAITGESVENVTVMLYDITKDSVILKEKPYYFARTEKSGNYSIKNVKPGVFKVVAIDEGQTPDLKWTPGSERIGFPDSLITLSDSINRLFLPLKIFKNQGRARITDKNAQGFGVVKIGWTDIAPKDAAIIFSENATAAGVKTLIETSKDTTLVWYDFPLDTTTIAWSLNVVDTNTTVQVKSFKRKEFAQRHRLRPYSESGGGGGGRGGRGGKPTPPPVPTQLPAKAIALVPGRLATLKFNYPITALDTAKWVAKLDTLPFRNFTLVPDSTSPRGLVLNGAWKPGTTLKMTLLPGAITDFYGLSNVDTILYEISILTDKQLGILSLTVEKVKPGTAYILEIMNGNAKELERKFTATEASTKLVFKDMPAATYSLKLIEDLNANGLWDTGSYFDHRQPELIFTKKLEPLRANWELEASMPAETESSKVGRKKGG